MTRPVDLEALGRATDADVRLLAGLAVQNAELFLGLLETLWTAQRTGEQLTPDLLDVIAVTLADGRRALTGLRAQCGMKEGS